MVVLRTHFFGEEAALAINSLFLTCGVDAAEDDVLLEFWHVCVAGACSVGCGEICHMQVSAEYAGDEGAVGGLTGCGCQCACGCGDIFDAFGAEHLP